MTTTRVTHTTPPEEVLPDAHYYVLLLDGATETCHGITGGMDVAAQLARSSSPELLAFVLCH